MMANQLMRFVRAVGGLARRRAGPDGFGGLLLALSILGGLLVVLRELNYGIGLLADSAAYISASRGLAAGEGFTAPLAGQLTGWAPLYPMLLSVGGFGDIAQSADWAGWLNAIAFGAVIYCTGGWLRRRLGAAVPGGRLLVLWGTLAVALSVSLTYWAAFAMSEMLFILFCVLALSWMDRHREDGRLSSLLGAAAFTALACLTRYIGVTLIITAGLLLLFQGYSWRQGWRIADFRRKVRRMGVFSVIALLPIGLWLLRNYLIPEPLLGRREASDAPGAALLTNLGDTAAGLLSWWVPGVPLSLSGGPLLLAGIGLAAFAVLIIILIIRQHPSKPGGAISGLTPRPVSGLLIIPGLFILVYLAWLIGSLTLVGNVDAISSGYRFLAPVYVPLTVILAALAGCWLRHCYGGGRGDGYADGDGRRLRRLKAALPLLPVAGMFLGLAYPAAANASAIQRGLSVETSYYTNPRWADSELAAYIREHLTELPPNRVYANDHYAPYLHGGGLWAPILPWDETDLAGVMNWAHQTFYDYGYEFGAVYFIWFKRGWVFFPPADYDRGRFEEYLPNPQPVFEGADGAVYRITAPESALWRIQSGGGDGIPAGRDGLPVGGGAYRSYGGDFTIHYNEREMLYLKEPCAPADAAAPFFLQVFPTDLEAAGEGLTARERGRGFADRGFSLHRWVGHIRAAPGQCLALARLPEFGARRIRTGQWDAAAARPRWQAEFPAADYLRRAQRAMAESGELLAEFAYTVYLESAGRDGNRADGYRLRYAKSPCAPGGGDAPFFLHLEPMDIADLPEERRAYGFDNRDFGFADYADGGGCAAEIPLPAYPIRQIRTGQFDAESGAQFWQAALAPPSESDTQAGETGAAAVARFTQTAHINGRQLLYTQRPCRAAAAELTLFLHLVPQQAADLPEWRRGDGFDNLDFRFRQRAVDTGDGCAALVELPDYPIAKINTGWYLPAQDRQVWNAELRVGE